MFLSTSTNMEGTGMLTGYCHELYAVKKRNFLKVWNTDTYKRLILLFPINDGLIFVVLENMHYILKAFSIELPTMESIHSAKASSQERK